MRLFQKNYFNSQELSHQKEASESSPLHNIVFSTGTSKVKPFKKKRNLYGLILFVKGFLLFNNLR